jgi:hypothetical protein
VAPPSQTSNEGGVNCRGEWALDRGAALKKPEWLKLTSGRQKTKWTDSRPSSDNGYALPNGVGKKTPLSKYCQVLIKLEVDGTS